MDDDVFQYGDRTILQLRTQPLTIEEEDYGTLCAPLGSGDVTLVTPVAFEGEGGGDRVAMLEQKLEGAMRRIDQLQQRIDSMDLTLARALNRM